MDWDRVDKDLYFDSIENISFTYPILRQLNFRLNHNKLERIEIKLLSSSQFDYDSKKLLDYLLDILVPLTPEKYELRHRLNEEITDAMKRRMQIWEISELENKIIQQVHSEYNVFDENELTPIEKIENGAQIKMLCLENWSPIGRNWNQIKYILMSELKSERIKAALANLKSISHHKCHYHLQPGENCCSDIIVSKIISILGNQLTSLHLDDNCTIYSKLASNITHLCLYSNQYLTSVNHLWHKVNRGMFSKLKHLKVQTALDAKDCGFILAKLPSISSQHASTFVQNLGSLIQNGLTSLHIQLSKLQLYDICETFRWKPKYFYNMSSKSRPRMPVSNFIAQIRTAVDQMQSAEDLTKCSPSFTLKIELDIESIHVEDGIDDYIDEDFAAYCESKQPFSSVMTQLSLLYLSLQRFFSNVSFGFRLNMQGLHCFNHFVAMRFHMSQIMEQDSLLNDTRSRFVDKFFGMTATALEIIDSGDVYERGSRGSMLLAFITKSKNIGAENQSCQSCHMEPIHEFQCQYCKPEPWFVRDSENFVSLLSVT